MTLLIDGDWLGYKTCASCETETKWTEWCHTLTVNPVEAKARASQQIGYWMNVTQDQDVRICLSSYPTFRHELSQEYKANRIGKRKPMALREVYDYLAVTYNGVTIGQLEADDVMGLLATSGQVNDPIIVSPDKDMKTVPGKLLVNDKVWNISKNEADRSWMTQALTGDRVDNVDGLPGVGPKTADKILGTTTTLREMWPVVVKAYQKKGKTFTDALLAARMTRILRHGDYDMEQQKLILWHPSQEQDLCEVSANV